MQASYRLTLNEQRLILACISQLDGRKPLPRDNMFTVTAQEFSESFNVSLDKAYEHLKESAENLFDRKIKSIQKLKSAPLSDPDADDQRWVYRAKYYKGLGKVMLGFSPSVVPYLTKLCGEFTSYQLKRVANLRSVHSIRLFEMLLSCKKDEDGKGVLNISLEDFKERLVLSDKYPRFFDLKRGVIDRAIKELEAKSNLEVILKAKKTGRIVDRLSFSFTNKSQLPLDLEPDFEPEPA